MKYYSGVDLSPSSSGVVLVDATGRPVDYEHFSMEGSTGSFHVRRSMARAVYNYVVSHVPDLVALEDYDMGPRNQHVPYQIAETSAIFKHNMVSNTDMPLALVNPRKLKSYVLKQKTVTKKHVMDWAAEHGFSPPVKTRGGPGYKKRAREDLCDAFVLARMARDLEVHLKEEHPAKKGHIFLDPEYGLACRPDLLLNSAVVCT